MAAMATITKPGTGVIPIVNGSLIPSRTQVGNFKQSWVSSRRGQLRSDSVRFVVRASDESSGSVVGQTPTSPIETGNSATEVKDAETTTPIEAAKIRKPSPLQKGGTLEGDEAAGKEPAGSTLGKKAALVDAGKFDDPRWRAGTWDITKFTSKGKINWDAVIDAGMSELWCN